MTADLIRALEFYSDPAHYKAPFTGGMGALYFDCGAKAREAIAAHRAQAPAEGDELPPLAVRMAAALREIAKPLAKGSRSIVERAADMLEAQPQCNGAEPAPAPCECPDRGHCDGSCAPYNQPSDGLPNIVKTAPETIYLVIDPDLSPEANFTELMRSFEDSVQWCSEDSYDNGIKYVRADLESDAQPKGTAEPVAEVRATGANSCELFFLPAGNQLKPGDKLYTGPAQAPAVAPQGFVSMPVEPTVPLQAAWNGTPWLDEVPVSEGFRRAYQNMLAAAAKPPVQHTAQQQGEN